MTRRARAAHHLIYDGVLTGRLISAAFLPLRPTSYLLFWREALSAVVLLQLELCTPNPRQPPRSSQTTASVLFRSLRLQYVHKPQFMQKCVRPGSVGSLQRAQCPRLES